MASASVMAVKTIRPVKVLSAEDGVMTARDRQFE